MGYIRNPFCSYFSLIICFLIATNDRNKCKGMKRISPIKTITEAYTIFGYRGLVYVILCRRVALDRDKFYNTYIL